MSIATRKDKIEAKLSRDPGVKISILTASRMWQSEFWTRNITNVLTQQEIEKKAPAPPPRNMAWRLFRQRKKFDVVATAGPVNFWYALLGLISLGSKTAHVAQELFLPEQESGWKYRLKRLVRRIVFSKTDRFVVYSNAERELWAEYLGLPVERFSTVLFHTNVLEPKLTKREAYGFAAGRSERDYATFFEAVRGLDYSFVVVSDPASVKSLDIPDNVELHCNIPYEKYLSLAQKASFTIVPLQVRQRSSGQVVILEGYAFGKPTIATRMVGTLDYVSDGETGFLCDPYSADSMRQCIMKCIAAPELVERMGRNAIDKVNQTYTFDAYVKNILAVLEQAVASKRSRI